MTAAQASSAGVDHLTQHRLVTAGLLERVAHGIYQVAGAQLADHPWIRVAWLRLDPHTPAWKRSGLGAKDGVVSHRSAAVLHRLGDIPAHDVELSVPRRRTTRESGVRLLTRPDLTEQDVTFISGLPVTTPERTILDLLHDHVDGGHVGRVIADADRQGLVNIDELGPRADGLGGRYGMPDASGRELLSELVAVIDRQLAADRVLGAADAAARLEYTAGIEGVVDQMTRSGVLADFTKFAAMASSMMQATQTSGIQSILDQYAKGGAMSEAMRSIAPPTELLRMLHGPVDAYSTATHQVAKDAAVQQNLGVPPEILRLAAAFAEAVRMTALPPNVIGDIAKIAAMGETHRHLYKALASTAASEHDVNDDRLKAAYEQGRRDALHKTNDEPGDDDELRLTAATPASTPWEV